MLFDRQYRSAEELVFEHLRSAILRGEFPPNTVINQEEIAGTLNVSRIPVRDALRRLHSVGLVRILPNKRTIVPSFTPHEIFEVFEMRAELEGLAVRHAVSNLTDSDFHDLTAMADVMRRVDDLDIYLERHEAFHDLIAARASMPRLRRDIAHLREIVGPYIRINGAAHQSAELDKDRHDALLAVIKTRNAAAAEKALASHVRSAGKQLMGAVETLTTATVDPAKIRKRLGRQLSGARSGR